MSKERGFTLIELLISITLVAALSSGLLMAMRTGVLTLEKVQNRLDDNRRVMSIQQMLVRQISSVMPAIGDCGAVRAPLFTGSPQGLRMVSSYSLTQGARGYPQYVEYQVATDPDGGLRLLENEYVFFGPASSGPVCDAPFQATPRTFEVARGLASVTFQYRELIPEAPATEKWLAVWTKPNLPSAVKIQIVPLHREPNRLMVQSVDVPIRITRDVTGQYEDQ